MVNAVVQFGNVLLLSSYFAAALVISLVSGSAIHVVIAPKKWWIQ